MWHQTKVRIPLPAHAGDSAGGWQWCDYLQVMPAVIHTQLDPSRAFLQGRAALLGSTVPVDAARVCKG